MYLFHFNIKCNYVFNSLFISNISLPFRTKAFHSIAKCVAALTVTCKQEAEEVVTTFVQHIVVYCNIYFSKNKMIRIIFCFVD